MDLSTLRSELEEYGHRLVELQRTLAQGRHAQGGREALGELAELAQTRRFLIETLEHGPIVEISDAVEAELMKLWAQTRRRIDELGAQAAAPASILNSAGSAASRGGPGRST